MRHPSPMKAVHKNTIAVWSDPVTSHPVNGEGDHQPEWNGRGGIRFAKIKQIELGPDGKPIWYLGAFQDALDQVRCSCFQSGFIWARQGSMDPWIFEWTLEIFPGVHTWTPTFVVQLCV